MKTLFDAMDETRGMTHTGDPETSRVAAALMVRSGAKARHAALVLSLVTRSPGLTAIELWHECTPEEQTTLKEPQEIRRRCCNLEEERKIRKGESRLCRIRGTKQVTWFVN